MTQVQLELLTDIDMVLFIEKGIRRGISQCSNRHAEAFNQYMQNFEEEKAKDENKNKETSFIMYYDVNNLVNEKNILHFLSIFVSIFKF